MNLRPEIKHFCDAAETLLSPVMMRSPLTEEERNMVKLYMDSLEKMVTNGSATPEPAMRVRGVVDFLVSSQSCSRLVVVNDRARSVVGGGALPENAVFFADGGWVYCGIVLPLPHTQKILQALRAANEGVFLDLRQWATLGVLAATIAREMFANGFD